MMEDPVRLRDRLGNMIASVSGNAAALERIAYNLADNQKQLRRERAHLKAMLDAIEGGLRERGIEDKQGFRAQTVFDAIDAETEECLKIANKYAAQEREDERIVGTAICYYAECIAVAIRELKGKRHA
jgi:hypothetical protein